MKDNQSELLEIMGQIQIIRERIANAIKAGKSQSGIDVYQAGLKALQKRAKALKANMCAGGQTEEANRGLDLRRKMERIEAGRIFVEQTRGVKAYVATLADGASNARFKVARAFVDADEEDLSRSGRGFKTYNVSGMKDGVYEAQSVWRSMTGHRAYFRVQDGAVTELFDTLKEAMNAARTEDCQVEASMDSSPTGDGASKEGWAELVGSEKQVDWATSIRAHAWKVVTASFDAIFRDINEEANEAGADTSALAKDADIAKRLLALAQKQWAERKDASWWIENRHRFDNIDADEWNDTRKLMRTFFKGQDFPRFFPEVEAWLDTMGAPAQEDSETKGVQAKPLPDAALGWVKDLQVDYDPSFVGWFKASGAFVPQWFDEDFARLLFHVRAVFNKLKTKRWSNDYVNFAGSGQLMFLLDKHPEALNWPGEKKPSDKHFLLHVLLAGTKGVLSNASLALAGGDLDSAKALYALATETYGAEMSRLSGLPKRKFEWLLFKKVLDYSSEHGMTPVKYATLAGSQLFDSDGSPKAPSPYWLRAGVMQFGQSDEGAKRIFDKVFKKMPFNLQVEVNTKLSQLTGADDKVRLRVLREVEPVDVAKAERFDTMGKHGMPIVVVNYMGQISGVRPMSAKAAKKAVGVSLTMAQRLADKLHRLMEQEIDEVDHGRDLPFGVSDGRFFLRRDGKYGATYDGSLGVRSIEPQPTLDKAFDRMKADSARDLVSSAWEQDEKKEREDKARKDEEERKKALERHLALKDKIVASIEDAPPPTGRKAGKQNFTVLKMAAGAKRKEGSGWTVYGWVNGSPVDLGLGKLAGTLGGLKGYLQYVDAVFDGSNAEQIKRDIKEIRQERFIGAGPLVNGKTIIEAALWQSAFNAFETYAKEMEGKPLSTKPLDFKDKRWTLKDAQRFTKGLSKEPNGNVGFSVDGTLFITSGKYMLRTPTSAPEGHHDLDIKWNQNLYKLDGATVAGIMADQAAIAAGAAGANVDVTRLMEVIRLIDKINHSAKPHHRAVVLRFTADGLYASHYGTQVLVGEMVRPPSADYAIGLGTLVLSRLLALTRGATMGFDGKGNTIHIQMDHHIEAILAGMRA